eukprot:1159554-Pelagomonas_calceolata.AAC.6
MAKSQLFNSGSDFQRQDDMRRKLRVCCACFKHNRVSLMDLIKHYSIHFLDGDSCPGARVTSRDSGYCCSALTGDTCTWAYQIENATQLLDACNHKFRIAAALSHSPHNNPPCCSFKATSSPYSTSPAFPSTPTASRALSSDLLALQQLVALLCDPSPISGPTKYAKWDLKGSRASFASDNGSLLCSESHDAMRCRAYQPGKTFAIHSPEQFKTVVDSYSRDQGKLVILEAKSSHCRPCKKFASTYLQLAQRFKDCVFLEVVGDESPVTRRMMAEAHASYIWHFICILMQEAGVRAGVKPTLQQLSKYNKTKGKRPDVPF